MTTKVLQDARILAESIIELYSISAPPVPVEDIIEDYGLKLNFIDLKEESDSIAGLFDPHTQTILVNINDHPKRQRFTIAHELGHALLHADKLKNNPDLGIYYRKSKDSYESPDEHNITEEKEANHFAAHILMPEKLLRKFAPLCNSSPIRLAEIFNVSAQALKFHLLNLNLGHLYDF